MDFPLNISFPGAPTSLSVPSTPPQLPLQAFPPAGGMGRLPTAPSPTQGLSGGQSGGTLQQILKLAVPGALALLAGLKGGPQGAAGFLGGMQAGQQRTQQLALQQQELESDRLLRQKQADVAERQLVIAEQNAQRAVSEARRAERLRFYELQKTFATPGVLTKLPRASQLQIIDSLVQGATRVGEDPEAVRAVLLPFLKTAEQDRYEAAQSVVPGFTKYLLAHRDELGTPEFLQKAFPTPVGSMTVTELLGLIPEAVPEPLKPQLRLVSDEFTDAEGNTTGSTRVVDLGTLKPGTVVARKSKRAAAPKPAPDPNSVGSNWVVRPGTDELPGTADDELVNKITGARKPLGGQPLLKRTDTPEAVTPGVLDLIRATRGKR